MRWTGRSGSHYFLIFFIIIFFARKHISFHCISPLSETHCFSSGLFKAPPLKSALIGQLTLTPEPALLTLSSCPHCCVFSFQLSLLFPIRAVCQDLLNINQRRSSSLREQDVILGCWTLCLAISQSSVPSVSLFDCI